MIHLENSSKPWSYLISSNLERKGGGGGDVIEIHSGNPSHEPSFLFTLAGRLLCMPAEEGVEVCGTSVEVGTLCGVRLGSRNSGTVWMLGLLEVRGMLGVVVLGIGAVGVLIECELLNTLGVFMVIDGRLISTLGVLGLVLWKKALFEFGVFCFLKGAGVLFVVSEEPAFTTVDGE